MSSRNLVEVSHGVISIREIAGGLQVPGAADGGGCGGGAEVAGTETALRVVASVASAAGVEISAEQPGFDAGACVHEVHAGDFERPAVGGLGYRFLVHGVVALAE